MLSDSAAIELASAMALDLGAVPGVVGIVLGGSRARGTHRPDSDIDLGTYVTADVDRDALSAVASRWADAPARIGGPGSWGPWVDSGAWLRVQTAPVDLILRDVDQVTEQCARAQRGEHALHVQPGHPFGFLDVAYAGELALGRVLVDHDGMLNALRADITPYPPALRASILDSLWQVDFLLDAAAKGADDATYVALCVSHAVTLLAHGWHAACDQWAINEKALVPHVDRLAAETGDFSRTARAIVDELGSDGAARRASVDRARQLPRPR